MCTVSSPMQRLFGIPVRLSVWLHLANGGSAAGRSTLVQVSGGQGGLTAYPGHAHVFVPLFVFQHFEYGAQSLSVLHDFPGQTPEPLASRMHMWSPCVQTSGWGVEPLGVHLLPP